jgi:hypothetical protein
MAIQASLIIGDPVCPSRVSHSCPGSNRFVCERDPVSQYAIVRARRQTPRPITHSALLTINGNTGSDRDTGTRIKTFQYRVPIQQTEAA